ncbi:MAG: efflux transporter outer membrane subunit [Alphaproteobacteria bacterium]|nr:efflux transporter outer membrane subunit [Alphaproteobacteria bacterium]
MKRLLVLISLLLAGCAGSKAPVPPEAAVTPPSAWRGAAAARDDAVDAQWWRSFNDQVLAQIVEAALQHNDDIAIAAGRVAEARAQFRLARAQLWPNIAIGGEGARERTINPGFGIPELQSAWQAEGGISYDLDLFGRLKDSSEAARANLLATEAARDNVRLAVAASAASGYITLCSLDARLAVLRDTLKAREEELRVARHRAQVGYSSQLDLAQADAAYQATRQLIPATELAVTKQEDGLSVLLGENPRGIERNRHFDGFAVPSIPVSVPASLLSRRPDIASAEQQLAATDHALNAARDAFMPDIQLAASGGYVGSTLIPSSPLLIWSLGASILAPIFTAGRLEAQQDAATARRDQAAFVYRKTALTAFREVQDALAAVQRLAEQEKTLEAQREVLAHALKLARNRYRAGYSPYLDQLDAQRQLLSAQLSLVQTHADRLTATIQLYQSLGGGWAASADDTAKAAERRNGP